MSDYPNEGYDGWLDALDDGEGYYLACPEGHGSLPPRRVCPACGADELREDPLPDVGEVETFTVTHVGSPQFEDDTPYVVAVVDFGPVQVTGQVRGVDPEAVSVGATVGVDVDATATTGEDVVVFAPR
jgi:uncharacterized OB-fold protein